MYLYQFLDKHNNVIYVGQTNNLFRRMRGHNHLPEECYDETETVLVTNSGGTVNTSIYEMYLISKHKPKYNDKFNSPEKLRYNLPELTWVTFNEYRKEYFERKKRLMKKRYGILRAPNQDTSEDRLLFYFEEMESGTKIKRKIVYEEILQVDGSTLRWLLLKPRVQKAMKRHGVEKVGHSFYKS